MLKSISQSLSFLIIAILSIVLIGGIAFLIFSLSKVKTLEILNVEVDCSTSKIFIDFIVRATEEIKKDNIKVFVENYQYPFQLEPNVLAPHSYGKITIDFLPPSVEKIDFWIRIFVDGTKIERPFKFACGSVVSIQKQRANLTFVAFSSPHWVVFSYIFGDYYLYASNNGDLIAEQGPYIGKVPIYENTNSFTIQTSWSSWENRPINSPIIIFKNPNPKDTWIFNWTDPHGTFLFKLNPVENAIEDMLIFWEDLFNPFNPPSRVDDWKDHVVRVTLIPPNTYRLAVFIAKGGYKHQFYVSTLNQNPLEGTLAYEKPYGAWWGNKVGDYWEEYKVYSINVS